MSKLNNKFFRTHRNLLQQETTVFHQNLFGVVIGFGVYWYGYVGIFAIAISYIITYIILYMVGEIQEYERLKNGEIHEP